MRCTSRHSPSAIGSCNRVQKSCCLVSVWPPESTPAFVSSISPEAEKLALQLNKFELALPSTPSGSSTMAAATTAVAPWLWSLPPHEHSCMKVTLCCPSRALMPSRRCLTDVSPFVQITISGGGGGSSAVGGAGVDLARGSSVAAKGGGAGSAQVRALALETLDATGVRR
jgi:hypothetical protein